MSLFSSALTIVVIKYGQVCCFRVLETELMVKYDVVVHEEIK